MNEKNVQVMENPFPFINFLSGIEYMSEVVQCMVEYCGATEDEAIIKLNQLWSDSPFVDQDDLRLHDDPYIWANLIQFGDGWWRDSSRWPPPKSFLDRWYTSPDSNSAN